MFSLEIKVTATSLINVIVVALRALEHDSDVKVNRVLIGKVIKGYPWWLKGIRLIHNLFLIPFLLCHKSAVINLPCLPTTCLSLPVLQESSALSHLFASPDSHTHLHTCSQSHHQLHSIYNTCPSAMASCPFVPALLSDRCLPFFFFVAELYSVFGTFWPHILFCLWGKHSEPLQKVLL